MLTEQEKRGMSELLSRMENRDLFSLAQTVTNRLILPESTGEAIQAIILHTDKSLDLLKRRKVKKDFLFKYLHDKKVSIEASADKITILRKVLEIWGSNDEVEMYIDDDNSYDAPPPAPVPSRNASHTSLCSLDLFPASFNVNSFKVDSNLRRTESSMSIMNFDESSNSSFTFGSSLLHQTETSPASLYSSLPTLNCSQPMFQSSQQVLPGTQSINSNTFTQSQCQEMANNFVSWFYEILNTCNNITTEFNPSMFWPDANAKVNLLGVNGETIESFLVEESAGDVCDKFKDVVRRHGLKFNPNLCDEGVRGRLDPHGLVVVLSCGTLHNQHTVCGVFEQAFCLVRDPGSENNWKIKQTEARFFAKSVIEEPNLANSSLCAIAYS